MITKTANYYLYKEAGLGNFAGNMFNTAKSWIMPRLNTMWNTSKRWWQNGGGAPVGFGTGMQNFANNAWGALRTRTQPLQQTMRNWWNTPTANNAAKTIASPTVPAVQNVVAAPMQQVQSSLMSATNPSMRSAMRQQGSF
jgi:hypothetical protein